MKNQMVAAGLLFKTLALKTMWEPEMRKPQRKKFTEKINKFL